MIVACRVRMHNKDVYLNGVNELTGVAVAVAIGVGGPSFPRSAKYT